MTFEEFFAKKKIDLDALIKAQPDLFSEFKSHYNLMGEKSFDHTKKYWFNKLRRLYHLATPEKAVTQFETKIASQAEPLSSPTIEQKVLEAPSEISEVVRPSAKPAFKPRNIPVKAEDKKDESTESAEPAAAPVKKPGFRPRNIKPADQETEDAKSLESRPGKTEVSDTPVTNPENALSAENKPVYKPKFKMRNVPKDPAGAEEQTGDTTEPKLIADAGNAVEDAGEAIKPAYKPKFNLKNIAKAKTEANEDATREDVTTPPLSEKNEEAESAKPAYKPRFNMKNIPQVKTEDKAVEGEKTLADSKAGSGNTPDETSELPAAKPVYKPKFSMKNLPKVIKEEDQTLDLKNEAGEIAQKEELKEPKPEDIIDQGFVAKPAYKPKFNMKNIKPKPPEE